MKNTVLPGKTIVKLIFVLFLLMLQLPATGLADSIISQPDVRKYNLALGKSIFHDKCIKCHGETTTEAPQLGQLQDWEKRIATPVDTLVEHALDGHGNMPPKGGFQKLSNREVAAAAAYIVDQGRRLIINSNGEITWNQSEFCIELQPTESCSKSQVDNTLLFQMLWIITGASEK